MFVGAPVARLVTITLVGVGATARLSVEFSVERLLRGAAAAPATAVSVNVPLVMLIVPMPPPLLMVLAASAPPLMLIVPAVPSVRLPFAAAKARGLLTRNVALVPSVSLWLRLMTPTPL